MPLVHAVSKRAPSLPQSGTEKKTKKHTALARTGSSSSSTQLQRLCDETRAQYELLLERQETNHERQLHAAQGKLQDVLCSHISLVEHEKVLFAESERFRSERSELVAAHARELAQLDAKWRSEWESREAALLAKCEEEKHMVLDMIPPLELERTNAHRLLKEQEIDKLTWSKALDEANRARERAEVRLREACKHILTLKACVKRLEQRPDTSSQDRERAMALHDKWQQSKLELANVRGELARRVAALEKDLAHAHEALADEKVRASDLQRVLESSVRSQEVATKLEMATQQQRARESKWRQQKAALQARVRHLASAARQLQAQEQERAHDARISHLLFGAEGDDDDAAGAE